MGCSPSWTREDDYRLRAGNYRVIYRLEGDRLVVLVVTIGHRRDVYRCPYPAGHRRGRHRLGPRTA